MKRRRRFKILDEDRFLTTPALYAFGILFLLVVCFILPSDYPQP